MNKKIQIWVGVVLVAFAALFVAIFLHNTTFAVLDPQGPIGLKERHLLIIVTLLGLLVIIPVFGLLFGFAWRYREGNTKAKYSPDLDHNVIAETVWWLIPLVIISIVSVLTWTSSHQLDPFKPLASSNPPITIQVIALQWKWLFIYPKQHIATVNDLRFPEKTPVNFQITADAPMNSFWIPRLGGQVYAMAGMMTQLHLMADKPGTYSGSSANISGKGFADMTFKASSLSQSDFNTWSSDTSKSSVALDDKSYTTLAMPGTQNRPLYFGSAQDGMFEQTILKYMMPDMSSESPSGMTGEHAEAIR